MNFKKGFVAAAVVAVASWGGTAVADVDSALPTYSKASGVSGNLSSVGSDTLANLMNIVGRRIYA